MLPKQGYLFKESYFFDGSEAAVEEITPSFLCNLVNKSVRMKFCN